MKRQSETTGQLNRDSTTFVEAKAGRKNAVINGSFLVKDRQENVSRTDGNVWAFTTNRWWSQVYQGTLSNGVGNARVLSTITSRDDSPNNRCRFEFQSDISARGVSAVKRLWHPIADARTFAGEDVTLSFEASSNTVTKVRVLLGQRFSGNTIQKHYDLGDIALTSVDAKYVLHAKLDDAVGQTVDGNSALFIIFVVALQDNEIFTTIPTPYNNIVGNDDLTLSEVQLEGGTVSTDFERRSVFEERDLCLPFYEVVEGYGISYQASSTAAQRFFAKLVPKRAPPASISVNQTAGAATGGNVAWFSDKFVVVNYEAAGLSHEWVGHLLVDSEIY